jgi:hypothetical protein
MLCSGLFFPLFRAGTTAHSDSPTVLKFEVIMAIVPAMPRGRRRIALKLALVLVLLAPCLSQAGCQQLSPEQQRALDEYRRSNVGPGAGTSP